MHDIQMAADFSFLPTKRVCDCSPRRLNCLTPHELPELSSTVIDVKQRHRWKEKHPARFIPQVPEKFIKLFSHRGETVLDPFCGSGTTNVVALQLGRSSIGIDVNYRSVQMTYERLIAQLTVQSSLSAAQPSLLTAQPLRLIVQPSRLATQPLTHHRVVCGSCLDVLPLIPDNSIDLIVTSPPYLDVVDYEDDHPEQWGNIHDYGEFLRKMTAALAEMKRTLKPHGWMVIITQDVFKSNAKCPIHADYIFICRDKLGFEVWHLPNRIHTLLARATTPRHGQPHRTHNYTLLASLCAQVTPTPRAKPSPAYRMRRQTRRSVCTSLYTHECIGVVVRYEGLFGKPRCFASRTITSLLHQPTSEHIVRCKASSLIPVMSYPAQVHPCASSPLLDFNQLPCPL